MGRAAKRLRCAMGEYAEMMLDGTCCSMCGDYLGGDGDGWAVVCASCEADAPTKPKKAFGCGKCSRRFAGRHALMQHKRDAHK